MLHGQIAVGCRARPLQPCHARAVLPRALGTSGIGYRPRVSARVPRVRASAKADVSEEPSTHHLQHEGATKDTVTDADVKINSGLSWGDAEPAAEGWHGMPRPSWRDVDWGT